jgi:hypothetical protein
MLLNQFLVDPGQATISYAINENRRKHLQLQLHGSGIDCEYSTIRRGSPHQFKVVKTFTALQTKTISWKGRREVAEKKICQIELLEAILGNEYEGVMQMLQATGRSGLSDRPAAGNTMHNAGNKREREGAEGTEGSKRRREDVTETIDLTSD